MEEQQIRSFIAVELPEEFKSILFQLQAEIRPAGYTFVKWVAPDGIHLTLKFLGNIPSSKVDAITKTITKASEGISQFQLETTELGVFPNLKRPNVFWLGVGGDLHALATLQKRIDDLLELMGFTREKRAFTPHLTLARLRENTSPQNRQDFGELIAKMHLDSKCRIDVNSISLMRSQLLPGGAVYSRLAEVELRSSK